MAAHALETLDRVEKPRPAADVLIEPRVPVRQNVEAGASLVIENTCDGIRVLFSKNRVGQGHFEGATMQIRGVPMGTRVGADYGGCEWFVFCCLKHDS